MDDFDCTEDTKSGTREGHNTILMIFQDQSDKNEETVSIPIRNYPKKQSDDTVLEWQKKLPFRKFCRLHKYD